MLKNRGKNTIISIILFFVTAFICLLSFTSCSENFEKISKNITSYNLNLTFDDNSKILSGVEDVDYINSYEVPLTYVEFHLYPNAFRKGAKHSPVSSLTYSKAYTNGFSEGKIDIKNASAGSNQNYEICGEDKNILKVNLDDELFPDERVKIHIVFEVLLPNCNHRFGYGENTYNFGNFYPIACVYENGSFREDVYGSAGDPFYSQMANYDVCICCDKSFVVASSGEQLSSSINADKKQTFIKGQVIRDFAFVLSKNYQVLSKKVNGIEIKYYYYNDENAQRSLDTTIKAINIFSDKFGKYPYKTYSVCKANFVHGGMEYPNLVYISDSIEDFDEYLNVIVHETAHQWWYNLVGSDAINNAWQDEGLTEYSTLLFYRYNEGYSINPQESLNASLSSYLLFSEIYESVYGSFDSKMSKNLSSFSGDMDYTYVTYVKGVLFFDSLEDLIGEKAFINGLKRYYTQNVYGIASKEDMIACFEFCSRRNLESFFDSWLNGKVILQSYHA